MDRRVMIAAAVAIAALGFGGGALTMHLADTHRLATGAAPGQAAPADQGLSWPFFGKPRAASAARAAPPKPDGFAVWKQRIDTSRPDAQGCIEMSRQLDPTRSYADFVLVSPDLGHPPGVKVNNDELCVGGLNLVDHRVTLLKGLPAKTGETLTANADVDFVFGDKPPYVGFAGTGVILPRDESDGVGIETLNVQKLAIEVWRVPDRNLVRREISAPDPTAEGEYAYDYGEDSPDSEGRVVWKGEVKVQGQAGQKVTTVFPLGAVLKEMKPGGYVIKARDASGGRDLKNEDGRPVDNNPPAQARRWIMFTDMGLSAYDGSEALDVVVRSLKTARILSGVRVALVAKNGEDLASATSDAQGRVRFARPLLKGDGASAAKMVMAYGSLGDLAVLDLDRSPVDLSSQGVGGRNAPDLTGREAKADIDAYLYADRGIYRPGETVRLTALVRDRLAHAVDGRKGYLVVKRPSGVEFKKIAFQRTPTGVLAQDIVLPATAPRGRWSAELMAEGIEEPVGALSFSVEDFVPQRLAVTLNANPGVALAGGETRKIPVSARFLYGAPGAGLQTQGEARLHADPNPFPQYKDYQWGDQQNAFDEKLVDLGTTVTDGSGAAVLNLSTAEAGDVRVPLAATVTASVFEPGGRPVRESASLKIRTLPLYFGVKVDQGEMGSGEAAPVSLDVIAVDAQGRRVGAQGVGWTLIAERWNYDWYQQNDRWQWRRTSRDAVVDKGLVSIGANGSLHLNRRLGWGDYRLEVDNGKGSKSLIRFSAGWGAPAKAEDAPDVARVSAGTKTWAQGDTVEVTIKPPYAGEAQVAVATDRLIDLKTLTIGEGGATVRLKTSAAWGGGAYVLVSVIQPRDPAKTPRPRRAMGLVYVPLDPKDQKLTLDLGVPAKLDSKAEVKVPVTVHGLKFGQRAHLTIAAVDEGILRLTKQDSPDPLKWYFGKRALTLNYRDDYGRLLDPNLGAPAAVNFGGDELGGEGLTKTPIKTVALWSGVVETGADGKAVVRLPAADFNGELRVMAVAWTDLAVGSAAQAVTVRQPVVADLNLPRFLSPGDKAFATLELHNLEGRVGGYLARLFADGGVLAPFQKLFQLAHNQRIAVHAPISAPSVSGISNVGFTVSGPGFTTTKTYPIETRLGWGPVTRTFTALQQPGEAYTPSPEMMRGLAAGSVTMQVGYSPFRGFDPGAIALALARYPYGCTEQLTSTAYPLLYAAELSSDPRMRRSTAALDDAVGRLLDRQTMDGAFGLWRVGDGEADPWLGAYATDLVVEAKAQGAAIPDTAYERALGAMRQISRPEGFASVGYQMAYPPWWLATEDASKRASERLRSRASAYALYVLAKAGRGDLARLRWWHDVQMKNEASPLAKAQVGAGLALMGDRARAHDALQQAANSLGYSDPNDWYQSPLRDLAGVIAYAYEAGEIGIARSLQGRLENETKDPDRLNTQEQSWLLQAAHAMLKVSGQPSIQAQGAYVMAPAAGAPRWSVGRLASARFVNAGRGAIWRTVTVRGVPLASPPAEAHGVSVEASYWTLSGAHADLSRLMQGDRVIVELSGQSHQSRTTALVLDDPLPAGFEIETKLGPADGEGNGSKGSTNGPYRFLGRIDAPSAQEARDDRYVAAMTLGGDKGFTVAYVARAVTPGAFYLPGVEARDMYHAEVYGRSAGDRVAIQAASP
ncbi:alpha-2-macroglobulin family protein [Phenylobacterium montanum]|uniref:Alpha-2-macroglobulin family protein n=1 Tax=Phenylobacterium montanum TaxID=2823693 RepID=A0A975FXY7_9CAUL|nr:alpha-2-macroglobulin [Caulobacter sp. S6]QUD87024.1 alpha-2-macroglobulin family protein [Caulobacter sp. S6]